MTANQSSTLRVENVPVGTEDSSLEDLFCDYGPIKRCFVVKPKKAGAKKTLGYVQFASHDDAQSAIQATQDKGIVLEGQDLKVRFFLPSQLLNFNYFLLDKHYVLYKLPKLYMIRKPTIPI